MSAHPSLPRLLRRRDFLRVATGGKGHAGLVTVQTRRQADDHPLGECRVGYTASKKVGNAVARNRAKRRLREAIRTAESLGLEPGHDYVILARPDTVTAPWPALLSSLRSAIRKANGGGRPGRSQPARH